MENGKFSRILFVNSLNLFICFVCHFISCGAFAKRFSVCVCVFFSLAMCIIIKKQLWVACSFGIFGWWVNVVILFLLLLPCAWNDVKLKCYVILRFWRRKCHEIATLTRSVPLVRANIPSLTIVFVYSSNRFGGV